MKLIKVSAIFSVGILFLSMNLASNNDKKASNNLKPTSQKQELATSTSVSQIVENGKYIILSDDTKWEIDPKSASTVQTWITPSTISISDSSDPLFPSLLTNETSQTSVKAKKVVMVNDTPKSADEEKILDEAMKMEEKAQEQPAQPIQKTMVPAKPVKPMDEETPKTPANPEAPMDSETQVNPEVPVDSDTPATPETPKEPSSNY